MDFVTDNFIKATEADVAYVPQQYAPISLICRMDSYKFSHPFAYPNAKLDGVIIKGMSSYGESRLSAETKIIPVGMQLFLQRYLTQRITTQDIDNAEQFAVAHFGRPLFDRAAWQRVVDEFNGYLPLTIRALPEGTPVTGGVPLYTVTVVDDSDVDNLFWMSAAFETMIQHAIWYPTTIATRDYATKALIKQYYTSTGADLALLPFALHDFGGRGVSSAETAEIGGFAHLVNFMGSDTVEGVITANQYYSDTMAGFSVYATEHSIQCSFGGSKQQAIDYISHQLTVAKQNNLPIVSIVLDGYDVFREVDICCNELKQQIIDCGAKVVFRPDSGDMNVVVPMILEKQAAAFGYTTNSLGYKKINNVGIVQGDGVDTDSIDALLNIVRSMNFAADNVIFGSGGALLQKVNRDTLKFAQKASAILVQQEDGSTKWIGIAKDPITDHGKRSTQGVLTTIRTDTGYQPLAVEQRTSSVPNDAMQLVYQNGTLYNNTTLAQIRKRCAL